MLPAFHVPSTGLAMYIGYSIFLPQVSCEVGRVGLEGPKLEGIYCTLICTFRRKQEDSIYIASGSDTGAKRERESKRVRE
jgi:hypothetical protein